MHRILKMSSLKFKYPKTKDNDGKGYIGGCLRYAKYRFIHVCHEYCRHRYFSATFTCLLISMSYLQMYGQLLDSSFIPRSSEEWGPFSFMTTIMDLFRLTPHMDSSASSALVLFFFDFFLLSSVSLFFFACDRLSLSS